jgi:hypothetical protein
VAFSKHAKEDPGSYKEGDEESPCRSEVERGGFDLSPRACEVIRAGLLGEAGFCERW